MVLTMNNAHCLITGGGKGIGNFTALYLLKSTSNFITIVSRSNLENYSDFTVFNDRFLFIQDDVTTCNFKDIFQQAYLKFGIYPDQFIINAGARNRSQLESTNSTQLDYLWKTNYFSFRQLLITLIEEKLIERVSLVYISSIVSKLGFVDLDDYGATKAASDSLIRSMSVRFPNARFNSISPGFTTTSYADNFKERLPDLYNWTLSRTPLGRWGDCEEITSVISFLLSDRASFICGQNIVVDGGWSINA